MRITVTMQDELMADLMKMTHARNKTQAMNLAIQEWMRFKKLQKIKSLRGNLDINNNLSKIRELEIDELKRLNE